jgi:RNA polymerase sigma factor for flagellar operon FliA
MVPDDNGSYRRARRRERLWKELHQADEPTRARAREALVTEYAKLALNAAAQIRSTLPSHVDPDELRVSAMYGLLVAVERFDPKQGARFEAFARKRIRGAVFDDLRAMDWAPRELRDFHRSVERTRDSLTTTLGRLARDDEVASALDVPTEAVVEALMHVDRRRPLSLDGSRAPDDGTAEEADLHDTVPNGEPTQEMLIEEQGKKDFVARAIAQLPTGQKLTIALLYYEHLTGREISEVLGVSEARVSQLHRQALRHIETFILGLLRDGQLSSSEAF